MVKKAIAIDDLLPPTFPNRQEINHPVTVMAWKRSSQDLRDDDVVVKLKFR